MKEETISKSLTIIGVLILIFLFVSVGSEYPTYNYLHRTFTCDGVCAIITLITFDLSEIPDSAIITEAELNITQS